MSNTLSIPRARGQTLLPDGEPTYGIMAADDYAQGYNDTLTTLEELNAAIEAAGCILDLVDESGDLFVGIDREQIGTDNFFGKLVTERY